MHGEVAKCPCENCGYSFEEHLGKNRDWCPDDNHGTALVHHRTTQFQPKVLYCVDCGDVALQGLKSAPRCEWCLAGPLKGGQADAFPFVCHARDHVAKQMNSLKDWHASHETLALYRGYERAYIILDHLGDLLSWLVATTPSKEQSEADLAFDKAIAEGRLSSFPGDSHYAGNYMFMGKRSDGVDLFKNRDTRRYLGTEHATFMTTSEATGRQHDYGEPGEIAEGTNVLGQAPGKGVNNG